MLLKLITFYLGILNKQIGFTSQALRIYNINIPRVVSSKFLGVYIDLHLKRNTRVEDIERISKYIHYPISRVSRLLPTSMPGADWPLAHLGNAQWPGLVTSPR